MKLKLLSLLGVLGLAAIATSNAALINLTILSNTTTGLITTTTPALVSDGLPTGRAIVVTVTTALNATSLATSFNALLATTQSTPSNFDTALNLLITETNNAATTPISASSNPGIVRSTTFASGAIASGPTSTELGTANNKSYLFFVAEAGGFITAIGAYTGPGTPGSGALTLNPAFAGDTLGIGTSVLAASSGSGATLTNASGFQLKAVTVPEPSAALLGAIGALGLLRRRRI